VIADAGGCPAWGSPDPINKQLEATRPITASEEDAATSKAYICATSYSDWWRVVHTVVGVWPSTASEKGPALPQSFVATMHAL
jgi:hypothetical protein